MPGQRQALVVGDPAALGDVADHVPVLHGHHDEADVAVVDEQPVARAHVVGQPRVRRGHPLGRARHVLGGDRDPVAGAPQHRAVGERAEPDLRALQVGEHADRAADLVRGPPDQLVHPLVLGPPRRG